MNTVEITHYLDSDGTTRIVSVPLTNVDSNAILYEDDLAILASLGVDPRWRLSQGQILERGKGRVSITRLVSNAGLGHKVHYLDRDPCNLRRSNLVTAAGSGKYKTRDKLTGKRSFFRERVQVKHNRIPPSWEQETSPNLT